MYGWPVREGESHAREEPGPPGGCSMSKPVTNSQGDRIFGTGTGFTVRIKAEEEPDMSDIHAYIGIDRAGRTHILGNHRSLKPSPATLEQWRDGYQHVLKVAVPVSQIVVGSCPSWSVKVLGSYPVQNTELRFESTTVY